MIKLSDKPVFSSERSSAKRAQRQYRPHRSFDSETWNDDGELALVDGKHKGIFLRWIICEVHFRVQADRRSP